MSSLNSLALENDGSLLIISRTSQRSHQEEEEEEENYLTAINKEGSEEIQENELLDVSIEEDIFNESSDEDFVEDLEGLDELIAHELRNLEYVQKMNASFREMISSTSSTRGSAVGGKANANEESICTADQKASDIKTTTEGTTTASKSNQPDRKLTPTPSRRRKTPRFNQATNMHVKEFIENYYKSLDTMSRYMMFATVLGFLTAFVLLTIYGSMTHSNDMELFKLQEGKERRREEDHQKTLLEHEKSRENMIHKKFEETRECHSTLKSYSTNQQNLLSKISNLEQRLYHAKTELKFKTDDNQRLQRTIDELNGIVRRLTDKKSNGLGSYWDYLKIFTYVASTFKGV